MGENAFKTCYILKCVSGVLFPTLTFTTLLCLVTKRKHLESVSYCHRPPWSSRNRAWFGEAAMRKFSLGRYCHQGMDPIEIPYVLAPIAYLIQPLLFAESLSVLVLAQGRVWNPFSSLFHNSRLSTMAHSKYPLIPLFPF